MSSIVNKIDKPWSVDQFEEFRPHMTSFVRSKVVPLLNQHDSSSIKRLLIHGQVKVGKREIVEYIAVRDSLNHLRVHVFISSFHRKADESQRDELETHGINVFSIHSARRRDAAIRFIGEHLTQNPSSCVVIHWDECDYGTGDRQNLAEMHKSFRDHSRIFNIYYSATPEEMLYSSEIAVNRDPENSLIADFYEDGVVVKYDPPAGYCGAQKFLDNGLVFQALPFFESCESGIKLSEQAKDILVQAKVELRVANRKRRDLQSKLEDAEDDGDMSRVEALRSEMKNIRVRNIISLRLSYFLNDDDDEDDESSESSSVVSSESKSVKAIYNFLKYSQFVEELNPKNVLIIADKPDVKELVSLGNVKTEVVQWGKRAYWDAITKDQLVIIVNDQTSTRSTEWACHDRVFATHDYRKRLTFNTVAQAQLRPAHYEQNYGGFQPIRIYGDLKTFRFAVGQISAAEYLNSNWFCRKVPKSEPPLYRIKHENDTKKVIVPMPAISITIGGAAVNFEGIPDNKGYSLEVSQKILVQLGGTNNGNSKMSQRVRGNSKRIPEIKSKFYPCEPAQKFDVLKAIKTDAEKVDGVIEDMIGGKDVKVEGEFTISKYLEPHSFSGALFNFTDSSGSFMGYLRGRKVLQFDQLKTELWGIRLGHEQIRLTECYRDGQLGLCLRFATGNTREANDLESYKSMYQDKEGK